MRTLKLHFPEEALPTLDSFLKQTKEAWVFRRAQAVRDVVKGHRLQNVSDALQFTYSALRKWVDRFANQGTQGLVGRPRSGRPPQVTGALAHHLDRLRQRVLDRNHRRFGSSLEHTIKNFRRACTRQHDAIRHHRQSGFVTE